MPRDDGIGLVQGISHGRQAVRGAGRGGNDLIVGGEDVLVDGVNDGLQILAGGSGDDDLLGAGFDVSHALFFAGVETGALKDDVDADFAPGALFGVFDRVDLDLLAVDDDGIIGGFDGMLLFADAAEEGTLGGIILQKMGQHLGAGQVVDGDDFVAIGFEHLTESQTANAAETVDRNFNRHGETSCKYGWTDLFRGLF